MRNHSLNKNYFDKHMRQHTGILPYSCSYCPKKFAQSSALDYHIRSVHTKETQFKCDQCKYSTLSSSSLQWTTSLVMQFMSDCSFFQQKNEQNEIKKKRNK